MLWSYVSGLAYAVLRRDMYLFDVTVGKVKFPWILPFG